MIQYPTPFRLKESTEKAFSGGNTQLPRDLHSGFMVTGQLLSLVATVLHPSGGRMILQSNCEDVAVFMRSTAERVAGFECVDVLDTVLEVESSAVLLPRRTIRWIEMDGARAVGPGWSRSPLLPSWAKAETEAAREIDGGIIHRCILRPK